MVRLAGLTPFELPPPHFHRFRQAWIVALGEALRAQHAVAEQLRRRGVRGRVGAGAGLPEQALESPQGLTD